MVFFTNPQEEELLLKLVELIISREDPIQKPKINRAVYISKFDKNRKEWGGMPMRAAPIAHEKIHPVFSNF